MKILYLEDNSRLATLTTDSLEKMGFVVDTTHSISHAEHLMSIETYDAYVLDRMIDGGQDAASLATRRKERGDATPVLLLTAMTGSKNRIEGFIAGADDYLEKPFDIQELSLRITKLAKHTSMPSKQKFVSITSHIKVDIMNMVVLKNEQAAALSPRLWRLLEYLVRNSGKTLTKAMIIDNVWGIDREVLDNTVEVAIKKLRAQLGDKDSSIIKTVHGFGYRLDSHDKDK